MVDAIDAEDVDRLPDIARRPLLARMREQRKAGLAGAPEHLGELRRRVTKFRRIKAHAHDLRPMRERGIEGYLSVFLIEVTQKTHDQAGADAELGLRLFDRAMQPLDHRRK